MSEFPEDVDVVSPLPVPEEREVEASLRPRTLTDFVGQPKVREQLELVLESARRRERPPDHILLSGPPGPGQDQPGHDRRGRTGRADPRHQRPGHRAGR